MESKKVFFHLIRQIVSVWFIILIPIIACETANAMDLGQAMALSIRSNVVQVEVFRSATKFNGGFGFIIGEQNNEVFIVTADHVVRSGTPEDVNNRVKVTYYGVGDSTYDARLLVYHDSTLDLAVLRAGYPHNLKWRRDVRGDQDNAFMRDKKVWFVGRSGGWYVPTSAGKIHEDQMRTVSIDNLPIFPGSSGAPLVNEHGIIGMLTDDKPGNSSEALKIPKIIEACKYWREVPWQLILSQLTDSGKARMNEYYREAEQMMRRWVTAFTSNDIFTLLKMSDPPFYFGEEILLNESEIKKAYLETLNQMNTYDRERTREAWKAVSLKAMTILEGLAKYGRGGWSTHTEKFLTKLEIGPSDIAVTATEGIAGYFRIKGDNVYMAGLGAP